MTHYRTRPSRVTAIRVPRSIETDPNNAPTRDQLYEAARPIVDFLGQPGLRSEHATVRVDGRIQVTIHQRPNRVYSAAGSDWIIKDEYGVFTAVDERTFRAFYEPATPPSVGDIVEARPVIEAVMADINAAMAASGWEVTFDFRRIGDPDDAEANDPDGPEDVSWKYDEPEPELPQDPTGVDCAERYESAADQA